MVHELRQDCFRTVQGFQRPYAGWLGHHSLKLAEAAMGGSGLLGGYTAVQQEDAGLYIRGLRCGTTGGCCAVQQEAAVWYSRRMRGCTTGGCGAVQQEDAGWYSRRLRDEGVTLCGCYKLPYADEEPL